MKKASELIGPSSFRSPGLHLLHQSVLRRCVQVLERLVVVSAADRLLDSSDRMTIELRRGEAALISLAVGALAPRPFEVEMRAIAVIAGELPVEEGHHPRLRRAGARFVGRDDLVDRSGQKPDFGAAQEAPRTLGRSVGRIGQPVSPRQGVGEALAWSAERTIVSRQRAGCGGGAECGAERQQTASVDRALILSAHETSSLGCLLSLVQRAAADYVAQRRAAAARGRQRHSRPAWPARGIRTAP